MLTAEIVGIDDVVKALQSLPDRIQGGAKVVGEAANYALVWEWGSARITKPGPKTTWGTNPDGRRVVLTLTAPNGYIRVNRDEYFSILKEELGKLRLGSVDLNDWEDNLNEMMLTASGRCAKVIIDHAPEDTGQLKASILPVEADDPILEGE